MRVRAVDASGDMLFGGDQATILRDTPETVGQVVRSRLNLWQGQWYLDHDAGLPVEQQILGKRTEPFRDAVIQAEILDTLGVVELLGYDSTLDRETRAFTVNARIGTAYSVAYRAGPPTNVATVKVEQGR